MRKLLLILGLIVSACNSTPSTVASSSEVSDEVSLKSDRRELEELRKDVPSEMRRENDELAFIRELMAQGTEEPGKVRERFNTALRKRRETFDKATKKKREDFAKNEKAMREKFLNELKSERDSFVSSNPKAKSEQRKSFFDSQETKRQSFFGDQKDRRSDFESKMTEERKGFEDYVRERTNEFNQEHRAYSSTYYDRKKALDLKKQQDAKAAKMQSGTSSGGTPAAPARSGQSSDPDLEAFRNIPKVPTTPLGTSAE